jgi:leucyl aminopeptidase
MEISVTTEISKTKSDTLLFLLSQDDFKPLTLLGDKLFQKIKTIIEREKFNARKYQTLIYNHNFDENNKKIILYGIGKKEDLNISEINTLFASAILYTEVNKNLIIEVHLPKEWYEKFPIDTILKNITIISETVLYKFDRYKTENNDDSFNLKKIFISLPPALLKNIHDGIEKGYFIAKSVNYAKDLVNEPAHVTTPSYLANEAEKIAKESKNNVKVKVLDKVQIQKLGMNAFLGVGQGSYQEPKLIILHYKPIKPLKKIVIAGKGITFDTGGLSLKNPEHMENMKIDMAGAAIVLSIFQSLACLDSQHEVIGIIPACENMPSGRSLRPGDIVKVYKGKSIEVLNTDAEGRLTLADALSYAVLTYKPDEIFDVATLTGACMVALGDKIAGLWSNKIEMVQRIKKSADMSGEKLWYMPLEKEYMDLLKSNIADIKNIQTGRYGGAITAALFLSYFINDTPWAHLDVAGPVFNENDNQYQKKGASGFGVKFFLDYLTSYND